MKTLWEKVGEKLKQQEGVQIAAHETPPGKTDLLEWKWSPPHFAFAALWRNTQSRVVSIVPARGSR